MTTSNTFINMKIFLAQQLIESLSEPNSSNLYLTFGYTQPWSNDSSPPIANTSQSTSYEHWRNMVGTKKITGNDVNHVIPRYDWTSGTVYTEYDSDNTSLYSTGIKFYVLTSTKNVYKCLSNNGGSASTIEPTAVNPATTTQTGDGYIWKYMYSLSSSDIIRFTTGTVIPIKLLTVDDGSLQWQVQQNALAGKVHVIKVTNGGSNYSNVSNLSVTITGDGSGATATASINTSTNTVSTITVINGGSNYSNASAYLTGGAGSGANLKVLISPPGGHGSNPLYELGGKSILINSKLIGDESGILSTNHDFRQIGIIKDPLLYSTGTVASNTSYSQTMDLIVSGTGGNYIQNEWVYQGASLATNTFRGRIVVHDSANNLVKLVDIIGTPNSDSLIGNESTTSKFISSINNPDLRYNSGNLLYIDNMIAINRQIDQSENFKIIIDL